MKSKHFFLGLLSALSFSIAHAEKNCVPVKMNDPKLSIWVAAKDIVSPGYYCLTADIIAPRRHEVFGGERDSAYYGILDVDASNVEIDLRGFTMDADASRLRGITASSQKKITIENGKIKSRTQSGILLNAPKASLLSDFKAIYDSPQTMGMAEDEFQKFLKSLPPSASAYQKTENVVERLYIESGSTIANYSGFFRKAIGMDGAANIIRNSTIEITDGHAAIYLFGPNQLIENNIIIFKGKAAVESAAAIKLHQADGTIIRNNDIIIESMGDEAPKAAISLIDSKDVVIENNRIYGINTLVKNWDEKSNSIDKNNAFRSLFRRPLTIGEPGVH